jgi:hypothetical protein
MVKPHFINMEKQENGAHDSRLCRSCLHSPLAGHKKKPDSIENLASEEGDEKLFVGLQEGFHLPEAVYILDRREPGKIFSEKQRYRKNYAFPARIQGLNYHRVSFFVDLPRKCSDFRPLI